MHLMVYYHTKEDFSILKEIISRISLDITLDETYQYEEAHAFYTNHKYDIVFIDYACAKSEEFLQQLLEKNKQQRVILLNDKYQCFDNKNCKRCQKEYNIVTVIKPLNLLQMATLLKHDFECESYMKKEKEFNLEKVVKSVLNKYPFLEFNRKKYFFDLTDIVNPLKTSILIELTEVLQKNAIEHHLFNDVLHVVGFSTQKKTL